jgi:hypothetical protein
MPANKEQCKAVGAAVINLFVALSDGLDLNDATQLQDLVAKAIAAVDDFQGDTDAAIAYALAGAIEAWGDRRLDVVVP